MDDTEATSLEQIRAFLAGSGEVRFAGQGREEVYDWVEKTLVRLEYANLNKPGKGLVGRYLARMTGLSRAQVTRLIGLQRRTGRVKAAVYARTKFATRYTAVDVDLLAYVDKAHGNLSGPATRRILEREYSDYGQAAVCASVVDLGGASLPTAQQRSLSQTQHHLSTHATDADSDRRAAQTATARRAGIPAHRHRASGRSTRTQRSISHQCRRRSHAVGDRG